ncbi:MBOAT family O-acyltransferase [Spirosoma foliorum]|nr:MBOAT family O-acyltransferase [Spirosoma foliorum]
MAFVPIYILILGFTIIIDYFAGILIEQSVGKKRRGYLLISLLANIGVLAFFKYYNFLNDNLTLLFSNFGYSNHIPYLSILLPIGLSFHTFQAMSYTIEVYRGNSKAERHFGIYALYVMFYPQLVAGPIERPQNVLWQFHKPHPFKSENIASGLKLMAWGFFKKVVIADRLAVIVNHVYNQPNQFEGVSLLLATILFAFQIYCDFSGYSDIALGTARTLGFQLMKNFDRPYFSKSIAEFWKRWHISLSTWFRDYLYIPLGGNRVSHSKWYANLLITFIISGLWHGANWTYLIWGGLNGLYLICENTLKPITRRISQSLGHSVSKSIGLILTFSLVCLAWVFFRASTVDDAFYIVTHLFSNIRASLKIITTTNLGTTKYEWVVAILALITLFTIEYLQGKQWFRNWLNYQPIYIRLSLYYTLVMLIILFGAFSNQEQFIYFQF